MRVMGVSFWMRSLGAVPGRLKRAGWRFSFDQRGATAVMAIVMLPAIIFAFVAGMKLWEVIMIRRSLHTGAYEATRYLSLYPPDTADPTVWQDVAKRFIYAELSNNPFASDVWPSETDRWAPVTVTVTGNQCTDKFTVEADFRLFLPGNLGASLLPELDWAVLKEVRTGEVICD
jgi:Flp pilus assembly protein TadG